MTIGKTSLANLMPQSSSKESTANDDNEKLIKRTLRNILPQKQKGLFGLVKKIQTDTINNISTIAPNNSSPIASNNMISSISNTSAVINIVEELRIKHQSQFSAQQQGQIDAQQGQPPTQHRDRFMKNQSVVIPMTSAVEEQLTLSIGFIFSCRYFCFTFTVYTTTI